MPARGCEAKKRGITPIVGLEAYLVPDRHARPPKETRAHITLLAETTQGYYNLFLAVMTVVGVLLLGTQRSAGVALLLAGTGSMLAAAVVLLTSNRRMVRAAAVQGALPLLAVILVALDAVTG